MPCGHPTDPLQTLCGPPADPLRTPCGPPIDPLLAPCLQTDLGVNAVLLDPVMAHLEEFDFFGVRPSSFMAPHPGLAWAGGKAGGSPHAAGEQLKACVKVTKPARPR
eukprot:425674-Prorocentrum_minimum.AAC.1